MKCPHCHVEFHDNVTPLGLGYDIDGLWRIEKQSCPACQRLVLQLVGHQRMSIPGARGFIEGSELSRYLVKPRAATRPAPPADVPTEFAQDYIESALVLSDSAKASAALSRRCLQHVLREKAHVKKTNLANEIEQVIGSGVLPTYLTRAIDAVRNIGNFAAHPIKSTASGEIVAVEPGEAEWNLDTLDGLFDFYFVQPAEHDRRKAALNAKLAAASKPPMK